MKAKINPKAALSYATETLIDVLQKQDKYVAILKDLMIKYNNVVADLQIVTEQRDAALKELEEMKKIN